ncbi:MAG: PilZ domain-containing protein [Dissulfurispiraceae bacterium]|jgi:hypothetical protein
MKNERRQHTRVTVEVDVEVSVQIDKNHRGRITDISEAGLFVETRNHVEEGSFIVIEFLGEIIMFGATVRRVAANGFGAEFGSMNKAHREVISRFIPRPQLARVSLVIQMPTVMLLCDEGSYPILERELKAGGFEVLEVRSIDKAISLLERFDVMGVVSDYIVGGKDTLSILNKIKERKIQPNFPVVIYSGRYDVPCNKFEELGIQCFSKGSTSPGNIVSHLKESFFKDDRQKQDAGLSVTVNFSR